MLQELLDNINFLYPPSIQTFFSSENVRVFLASMQSPNFSSDLPGFQPPFNHLSIYSQEAFRYTSVSSGLGMKDVTSLHNDPATSHQCGYFLSI